MCVILHYGKKDMCNILLNGGCGQLSVLCPTPSHAHPEERFKGVGVEGGGGGWGGGGGCINSL